MRVSARDVYYALRRAGFSPIEAVVMTAIAYAESGFDTDAVYSTPNEHSVGVFQINLKAHPNVSESCARDLDCSAQAARAIYLAQGYQAWSAYGTDRYWEGVRIVQQELGDELGTALPPQALPNPVAPSPILPGLGEEETTWTGTALRALIESLVYNGPLGAIGAFLVFVGAVGIVWKSPVGKTIVSVAGDIAGGGGGRLIRGTVRRAIRRGVGRAEL